MKTPTQCSVESCTRNVRSSGLCGPHYHRQRRHGDPTKGRVFDGERWDYMLKHMHDDCPKWPFSVNGGGRATIYDPSHGRERLMQQVVCEMTHGPRPDGHEASHKCGKGHLGCFGVSCITWKTVSANQMDRVRHGTSNRGTRQWMSKLSPELVDEIRSCDGSLTQSAMAERFGVSQSTISVIRSKKSWGWVS